MATQLKRRRGTNAQSEAFTGADGEIVIDSTNERAVVHDGATVGGFPIPHFKDVQNQIFTAVNGVGTNTITLTLAKAPPAYATYQNFWFIPAADNTTAVTLNVNGLGAKNIYKHTGGGTLAALAAGDLQQSIPANVIYDGTQFVLQGASGSTVNVQSFTSSGTWTKPSSGTYAFVYAGAGGGSGGGGIAASAGSGGGGGGFKVAVLLLSALGATETVTIGAGGVGVTGSLGNVGGNTTFGSFVTAYGGAPGGGQLLSGGGGGGATSTNTNASNKNLPTTYEQAMIDACGSETTNEHSRGGSPHGGRAGYTDATDADALAGGHSTDGGGGGGAYSSTGTGGKGGDSVNGGGGGGGASGTATLANGAGGASVNGGGGGGAGAEDSAPGPGAGGVSTYGGNGGAGAYDANNATAGSQATHIGGGGGGGGSETGTSGAGGAGKMVVIVI